MRDCKPGRTLSWATLLVFTAIFGVIGCGAWGREILTHLATLPRAEVVAVCDHYESFLNRAKNAAPKAEGYLDYEKLLENKDVQAVIVATPTHQHKEIVLAALAANKHVYCEAPLAHIPDAAFTFGDFYRSQRDWALPLNSNMLIPHPEHDDLIDSLDFSEPYICITGGSRAALARPPPPRPGRRAQALRLRGRACDSRPRSQRYSFSPIRLATHRPRTKKTSLRRFT